MNDEAKINIAGIDKARLLHALVTKGRPVGLGALQSRTFTIEEAQEWIDRGISHDTAKAGHRRLYFDYVCGVPVKSDLGGDEVAPWLYDRDQGVGAFARVVEELRRGGA